MILEQYIEIGDHEYKNIKYENYSTVEYIDRHYEYERKRCKMVLWLNIAQHFGQALIIRAGFDYYSGYYWEEDEYKNNKIKNKISCAAEMMDRACL